MRWLVCQTVHQHGSRYVSSNLSSNITNIHPYDGYGDNLGKTLGGFFGCAPMLRVWFIVNPESVHPPLLPQ